MVSPIQISNFFLDKSFDEGKPMTNMNLLKLVYIAHGWYLGITGKPLINEAVKAWRYGPVIESIYNTFKSNKGNAITKIPILPVSVDISDKEEFLTKIWDVYKKYDGLQLSTLTHKKGTPWDITISTRGVHSIIPNDLIQDHYRKRIESSKVEA